MNWIWEFRWRIKRVRRLEGFYWTREKSWPWVGKAIFITNEWIVEDLVLTIDRTTRRIIT
jgi:hypothetical protein